MDYTLECEPGHFVLDFNPKPKAPTPSQYAQKLSETAVIIKPFVLKDDDNNHKSE